MFYRFGWHEENVEKKQTRDVMSTDYVNFSVQSDKVSTHHCCKAARV